MRVDELLRSLVRRPLALLLIVAVAAIGASIGWSRASSTYESRATVVVVPPDASGTSADGTPDNPFTRLDYSISQLALVVSSQLESDAVRDQVESVAGGRVDYTAGTLSSDNSAVAQLTPQVQLSASAATPAAAQRAVGVLVDQAEAQLAAVQSASDIAPAAQAQVVVSATPTAATLVGNPQLRSAGVLGIAAGFAALLVMVVLQPLMGRRPTVATAAPRPPQKRTAPESAGAGRFAPRPAAAPEPSAEITPMTRRRQETLRQMVRDDWQRSGSNVPWTRREQREAYQRAEERLAERERQRRGPDADEVGHIDDFLRFRDHG